MDTSAETLIFLHIPKTGGTTLYKILERRYPRDQILSFNGRDHRREIEYFISLPEAQRARYRLIKGHLRFGLHRYVPGDSTYITFLREPVARALSFYYYACSHPEHYLHQSLREGRVELKTLLERRATHELFNQQTRMIAGGGWDDPQRAVDHLALERAKQNLRVHFGLVGLMEEFDASLLLLRRTFLWSLPFYIRKNVTAETPYTEALDTETCTLLHEANALDVELYEFAGELFNAQRRAAGNRFDSELRHFQRLNRAYAGAYEGCLRVRDGAKQLLATC